MYEIFEKFITGGLSIYQTVSVIFLFYINSLIIWGAKTWWQSYSKKNMASNHDKTVYAKYRERYKPSLINYLKVNTLNTPHKRTLFNPLENLDLEVPDFTFHNEKLEELRKKLMKDTDTFFWTWAKNTFPSRSNPELNSPDFYNDPNEEKRIRAANELDRLARKMINSWEELSTACNKHFDTPIES